MSTKSPLRFPSATASGTYPRKPDTSRDLTSERIAAHLDAFRAAGGTVEVLGTTPVLKRLLQDAPVAT